MQWNLPHQPLVLDSFLATVNMKNVVHRPEQHAGIKGRIMSAPNPPRKLVSLEAVRKVVFIPQYKIQSRLGLY